MAPKPRAPFDATGKRAGVNCASRSARQHLGEHGEAAITLAALPSAVR